MIGFDIEVNIYSGRRIPQEGKTATFSSADYNTVKEMALKFAEIFQGDDTFCNFFISYNIFNDEGIKKASTLLYAKELP